MPQVFDQLSIKQIELLPRDRTVFFIAVAPLEDHGPHLPIGLDTRWAVQLAYRTALKLEADCPGWVAILLPTAPLGIDANTSKFAVKVRPHVLRDYLVDTCLSLNRSGFRHFACFSGHLGPKQLTAIEEAGKHVRRLSGGWGWRKLFRVGRPAVLVSACSPLVSRRQVFQAPFAPDPTEHGGAVDTSVALAIEPKAVDPSYRALGKVERPPMSWARAWRRWRGSVQGYWGVPSQASAEKGEALLGEQLEIIYPKLRAVWQGAPSDPLFRSWYSYLPPNHSFFLAYVLAFVAFLLMAAWFLITMDAFRG